MIIKQKKKYALIIIGGGSAGIAAAISSARQNIKVALIEQRPVLGGNSSKEIGVHLTGSTRNVNTAYSRESGIIENLKLENLYQNPQGNLELWNVVLKNAVKEQKNLDVFLNTNITEVITDKSKIIKVKGDILGSEKKIEFKAPFFVDSTGDGTIGYLAGAKYRMGRESKNKYNESEAPEKTESYTMPSSLLFRIKKTNYPVDFIKPCWAYKFTEEDLKNYNHKLQENKSHFSWIEWGGEHDIIKDNEEIRTELEKILYGIWDHLKNGSEHREKYKNYDLEWVSYIPGKRSSRRLLGPYILTQQDIINRNSFSDNVAYGGYCLDDHYSDGFWSGKGFQDHIHPPGIYAIPLRCLYSINIKNLFMAGRNASFSHVALGSTRVQSTCVQMGEAVGVTAAECDRAGKFPEDLEKNHIEKIQQELLKNDHFIPHIKYNDSSNLAPKAKITASSSYSTTNSLREWSDTVSIKEGRLIMFPLNYGRLDKISTLLKCESYTNLEVILWKGGEEFFPVKKISKKNMELTPDKKPKWIDIDINCNLKDNSGWYFIELKGENIKLCCTNNKLPGYRLLKPIKHPRIINKCSKWKGDYNKGPLIKIYPNQESFLATNIINGISRPTSKPNLWISAKTDFPEYITLEWDKPHRFDTIQFLFDTDLDREIDNLGKKHKSNVMQDCIKSYRIEVGDGCNWNCVKTITDNYQRRKVHSFPAQKATHLRVVVQETWGSPYAKVYSIRVYNKKKVLS